MRGAYLEILSSCVMGEREMLLGEQIKGIVCDIMQLNPNEEIGLELGFFDSGMDSLMSLEFRQKLESVYDITLPPTVAFNYPTIGELMGYLRDSVLDINFSALAGGGSEFNSEKNTAEENAHGSEMLSTNRVSESSSLQGSTEEQDFLIDDLSEDDLARLLEEQLTAMMEE